jgi:hypothetical protein
VTALQGRADARGLIAWVTVAPGAGRGAPACFLPASAEIEVNGDHLGVDPATADPASLAGHGQVRPATGATSAVILAEKAEPTVLPTYQRTAASRARRGAGPGKRNGFTAEPER